MAEACGQDMSVAESKGAPATRAPNYVPG